MALAAAIDRCLLAMLVWCADRAWLHGAGRPRKPLTSSPCLINRCVPFAVWLITPAVFAATMLPAWALGWPASSLATIYFNQPEYFTALSLNAPNIWVIVQILPLGLPARRLWLRSRRDRSNRHSIRALYSARPLDQRTLVVGRATGAAADRRLSFAHARTLFLPGRRPVARNIDLRLHLARHRRRLPHRGLVSAGRERVPALPSAPAAAARSRACCSAGFAPSA